MTLPYPRRAFDNAQAVRASWRPVLDTDKLTGIAITIAIHLLIAAAALTVVQVARPKVMQELSVQIAPEKIRSAQDVAPPLKLAVPTAVTAPLPEVVVQTVTPPPVTAQTAIKPVPPTPMVSHAAAEGETRDNFLGRLLAQLGRFKQYPRAARQAHIEGVVMLHFVMDAQGRVQSFEIAKSSGRPGLDAEALALIQRAQPLPALPADYPTRTLDAVVPIEFSLNG
jgi:TonB family protein